MYNTDNARPDFIATISPWRWLVVGVGAALFCGAAMRLAERRADVRLSFRAGAGEVNVRAVTATGRVLALETADRATDRRVVVTTIGSGRVTMMAPFTSQGGRLVDLSQYSISTGDWQVVGDWSQSNGWRGGEWQATEPGAVLAWSGHAANLELEFKTCPGGGGVEVVADGVALAPLSLDGIEGTKRLAVDTPNRLATSTVSVSELPATIELPTDAEPVSAAIVSDGHTVYSCKLPKAVREVSLPSIPYASSSTYARRVAVLVARALAVNGLFVMLGAPFCLSIFASRSPVVAVAAAWAAGMSLTILLATSLTYVLAGAAATLIAVSVVLCAGYAIIVRNPNAPKVILARICRSRWLLVLLGIGCAGGLFSFAPAITEDGWFLGQSLTDSMDYIAWSERLLGLSLQDAKIAPWRIADLATLVVVSTLTGVNTREGYALAAFGFFMILPLLTHAVLEAVEASADAAACGAAIAASLSIYPQLFDFSYFGQYINAFVLHAGMLAGCLLLDKKHPIPKDTWWVSHGALAGPLALGLAMYPYQAIPPLVLIMGLFLGWLRQRSRYGAAMLLTQGLLAAALSNRSLAIGIDFFQSKLSTFGYLDALARNIVFPFHSSFRFVCIVTGCRDITMTHTYWSSLPAFATGGPWWMPLYATSAIMAAVVIGLLSLAAVGLYSLARYRSNPAAYVVAVYLCFTVATVALFATNHTYSYGKYMLACGTLVAVPVSIGIARLARGTRLGFYGGAAYLAVFVFFNMASTLLDQSLLRESRASSFLFNKRTHLAAVDVGVRELDRWAQTLPPNTKICIVGNYARGAHADTDRVLYNRILHALRGTDVTFQAVVCPIYTASTQFGIVDGPINGCLFDYIVVFRGYQHLLPSTAHANALHCAVLRNKDFEVIRGFRGSVGCLDREEVMGSRMGGETEL